MLLLALSFACKQDDPEPVGPGPLGIPIAQDGITWAGAAVIDVTPEIRETFTDLNGDHTFQGCVDDPVGCAEPFDDVDGDGWFDAVWIGGFGPLRPANGVHDPITVRALVIAHDGGYVAIATMDLVGLGHPRIWQARDALAADGFDPERFVAAASHNHDGPDTMGLWGNPYIGVPGFDPAYQDHIALAIEEAVRDAAAAMQPVDLRVGAVNLRDRSPWFSGPVFGGKNPTAKMHGMVHDIRDPVVVSDQVLVLQGNGEDGAVFTLTSWSGHPEVRDGNNNELSSDWVGVTRNVLEAEYGGTALHVPESLGGMMSALGGDLPLVLEDGTHVYATCDAAAVADPADADCYGKPEGSDRLDADGDRVPVWSPKSSWDFVTSHGWHIAEAAMDALADGQDAQGAPVRVERERFVMPITNQAYNLLGPSGLFDMGIDQAVRDPAECPEIGADVLGCFEAHVFRLQIGPVGFATVPGELLPELAWGLPEDDPAWVAEGGSQDLRGPDSRYFPQHDPDCLTAVSDFEECRVEFEVDGCDCTKIHAWPYRVTDAGQEPILAHLDTPYRAAISMTDSYFSYVVPEPDFHHGVSLLLGVDGDHYEDTVSASTVFGDRILEAHARIADRW